MEFCAWRDDGPAYRPPLVTEKVRSWNAAQRWREANPGQVVFTNGVFDLLHPGHLAALETARSWGDLLVVGINDDASAARLAKGRGRPIVAAADRARLVAGFGVVDCVVVFEEDTPERLIAHLAPDVLVKGNEYDPDTLPGGAFVRDRGGRVEIADRVPGYSTTRLIERINDVTT